MTRGAAKSTVFPRQNLALLALLSGASEEAAAEAAGVSRATVSRWLRNDTFRDALDGAAEVALSTATVRLTGLASRAVDVLGEILAGDGCDSVRLKAATTALDLCMKLQERRDLVARIEALEKEMEHGIVGTCCEN